MKTDRQRLRRQLLLVSAPVVVVVLILAGKLASVAVVGDSVVTDYAHRDTAALSDDVAILHRFNVIEPARTSYAGGSLAGLQHPRPAADPPPANSATPWLAPQPTDRARFGSTSS